MTQTPSLPARAWRHLRNGTLWATLRRKYGPPPLNRFNAKTPDEAARVLANLAVGTLKNGARTVLVAGAPGAYF